MRCISRVVPGLVAAGLLTGCVAEPSPPPATSAAPVLVPAAPAPVGAPVAAIVVPTAPPAPRIEVVPPPPRPAEIVVSRPGHWRWDGREYAWVPGEYVDRPNRTSVWEPGRWVQSGSGWTWIEGRWR